MHIEIFSRRRLSGRKEWRWRAVANNGRKIAGSLEGYMNLSDLLSALDILRKGIGTALVEEKENEI